MDLEPSGHDSSIKIWKKSFGENLVKFTCAREVLQEVSYVEHNCYKRNKIATRGDNSSNDKVNQMKMGLDFFIIN